MGSRFSQHEQMIKHQLGAALLMLVAFFEAGAGGLQFPGWAGDAAVDEPLPVEEAFTLQARTIAPGSIELFWQIADGYYMYRDKSSVSVASPHKFAVPPQWPETLTISDPQFGEVEIYRNQVALQLRLQEFVGDSDIPTLSVRYQGCKENSVCYPPVTTSLSFAELWQGNATPTAGPAQSGLVTASSESDGKGGNLLWLVIGIAFVTGLGLALTPCVLPLVPLVSGFLVGTASGSSSLRATALTLIYVLSMASVYGLMGIIAAAADFNIQAASQAPLFVIIFGGFLALMGLAMLDVFQLQLPAFIRQWLDATGRRQKTGSIKGAAILGVISAFMVGPCTAPPLLAALAFANIAQQPALAGTAMFFMGLGLGLPLLLLGFSAGALLPKAGAWMQTIKHFFGVGLLALALWVVQRLLPDLAVMLLWALLLVGVAVALGALEPLSGKGTWPRLGKALGLLLLVYGIALAIGAAQGNRNPLQPLARANGMSGSTEQPELQFVQISSVEELRAAIAAAATTQQTVMLDYRADWCTVCLKFENETFKNPQVVAALRQIKLLQVDVTDYDQPAQELLNEYSLHGPPAILFFRGATELRQSRIYEFMDAATFIQHTQFVTAL